MPESYFIREAKERDYTMMDNTFLRDSALSAKAKGIFAYLLMLPDDWKINVKELPSHFTDGRDSIYEGIKELKIRGYFEIKTRRNNQGRMDGIDYVVREKPQPEIPYTENPDTDLPETDTPDTENPTLLNTDSTKYGIIVSTDSNNTHSAPEKNSFEEAQIWFDSIKKRIEKEGEEDIEEHVLDFYNYWTALTKTKKPLWRTEKTFAIELRQKNWARIASKNSQSNLPRNAKKFSGVAL